MFRHVFPQSILLPLFFHSIEELRILDAEKEKNDEASPKGVIEACFQDFESKITPHDSPKAEVGCVNSGALSNWSKFFKLWKRRSGKHRASLPLHAQILSKKSSRSAKENPVLRDLYNFKSSLENFSLPELLAATDNFNPGMQLISRLRVLAKLVCMCLVCFYSRIWQNRCSLVPLLTMRKYELT